MSTQGKPLTFRGGLTRLSSGRPTPKGTQANVCFTFRRKETSPSHSFSISRPTQRKHSIYGKIRFTCRSKGPFHRHTHSGEDLLHFPPHSTEIVKLWENMLYSPARLKLNQECGLYLAISLCMPA